MAQTLTNTSVSVSLYGSVTDKFDLHVPQSGFTITQGSSLANGTGDNQINYVWAKVGKMGSSGSNTIDLYGVESDIYGNLMVLNTLKVLVVKNTSTNPDSELRITTNGIGFIGGTTPYIPVEPGAFVNINSLLDGWDISPGTADTITITNTNSNDGATYEFMVGGVQIDASSSSSSYSSASSSSSSPLKSSSSSSSSSP
jgi:hypothetical protein